MSRCAELLDEQIEVDFVDINAGCPIDLVVNKGAGDNPYVSFEILELTKSFTGSALLERKTRMKAIVTSMSSVLSCPLTIKVRIVQIKW